MALHALASGENGGILLARPPRGRLGSAGGHHEVTGHLVPAEEDAGNVDARVHVGLEAGQDDVVLGLALAALLGYAGLDLVGKGSVLQQVPRARGVQGRLAFEEGTSSTTQ